jgi:L-2-hydroxyglutarate oxidase LhgO
MDVDVAVIGGGVVGLSSAYALAEQGASVCLLESDTRLGHGTSTRNSGVIHAGLYYPAGSLKATLCIEGRDRLYSFCASHDVPHSRCGKLVVARDDSEVPALERLLERAHGNGVTSAALVDPSFIREREPYVTGAAAAIWSPETGIVQAEAFVKALARDCAERDVAIVVDSPVIAASPKGGGIELTTPHERIEAAAVVNASGLYADCVSALLGAQPFTIPARPRVRGWPATEGP